ncbi:hypothetical protein [Nocardioides solisilvae]|uniref:hypothetical protein n=1 Tax=Nocardioides solisilvae TaxID=1542435 RepID=UPI0013A554A7|nr:hypothetical protein [Nocardioides solisilvae]
MHSSVLRRTLAAGASLAVAGAGIAALGSSATAQSASLSYDCLLLGSIESTFTTVADTDLPAQVTVGSTTPVQVTATITVPEGTANAARGLGTSVSGTATINATIGGVATPATVTVPATSTGASGPLVLNVSGALDAPYVADAAGNKIVEADSYTANLTFTGGAFDPFNVGVTCESPDSQDTTVDTFTVVESETPTEEPSPSESPSPSASPSESPSPSASPSESPSESPTASASPSTSPSASASPTVSPSPSASTSPSASPTASPTATVAPTPAVQKTTTTLSTIVKKRQGKLVAKVKVVGADGKPVAGDVKLVLKQGKEKSKAKVTLNTFGKGKNAFTGIGVGKYQVTAKYQGGATAKKSRDNATVKVK